MPVGKANPEAFGLVVINRPKDAVTNINKRDGSHIEFPSCDQIRHDDGCRGVAQLVCMNNSESLNCNDLHFGGLAKAIMQMPDDCGFATQGSQRLERFGYKVKLNRTEDIEGQTKETEML